MQPRNGSEAIVGQIHTCLFKAWAYPMAPRVGSSATRAEICPSVPPVIRKRRSLAFESVVGWVWQWRSQ